jgi:hypothetical protein
MAAPIAANWSHLVFIFISENFAGRALMPTGTKLRRQYNVMDINAARKMSGHLKREVYLQLTSSDAVGCHH